MKPLGVGEHYQVAIEDLAFRGDGITHIDGKVVFIPFCLPGEKIKCEITEEKKDFARAKIIDLLEESPNRVQPKCRHFGVCGGCQMQHLEYSEQVRVKSKWAKEAFKSIEVHQSKPIDWEKPVASDSPWSYRSRIQLHRGRNKEWGFFQGKSHDLVSIKECPIAEPMSLEVLPQVISLIGGEDIQDFELVYNAELNELYLGLPEISELKKFESISGITCVYHLDQGTFHFLRKVLGRMMRCSAQAFFQVHADQNENLVQSVLKFSGALDGEQEKQEKQVVWDFYSGGGNFSIPLAKHFGSVVSVEESSRAIKDLRFNAQFNNLQNIKAIKGKVENVWPRLLKEKEAPDLILVNPPRTGAKEFMKKLAAWQNPKSKPKIIYVSCDLACLKRDVKILIEKGYQIDRGQILDLFPQTYHFETVLLLHHPCFSS